MKFLLQLFTIGVLLSSMFFLSKGIFEQWSKLNDLQKVEDQVGLLRDDNISLKAELGEQASTFNLERQARDKLGYKRPGEVLYVVRQGDGENSDSKQEKTENWKLWMEFIFH